MGGPFYVEGGFFSGEEDGRPFGPSESFAPIRLP